MWWSAVARFLGGTEPVCPDCGGLTRVTSERVVHDCPWVIETRYRCCRCAEEIVRCDVVGVW